MLAGFVRLFLRLAQAGSFSSESSIQVHLILGSCGPTLTALRTLSPLEAAGLEERPLTWKSGDQFSFWVCHCLAVLPWESH